ncbi:MAG: hypothetical protein K2H43_01550, partial [Clostridia bacterium]|nr:hypothetical protein [Clostridia bacterium]
DTLCEWVGKKLPARIVSSVDPIKRLAKSGGWQGEKDDKGRLLLVRLKQAFVEYNDLPLRYLLREYEEYLKSGARVMFVHIREPREIEKFKAAVGENCKTLLVTRDTGVEWHNDSDGGVSGYDYDYRFANDAPLPQAREEFRRLIESILK